METTQERPLDEIERISSDRQKMTTVNLLNVLENFFNSLFLVFSTFTSGIVIGLLVFGLTMTINVSRAFVFVIIASITAAFIRCVYHEVDDEVILTRSTRSAFVHDQQPQAMTTAVVDGLPPPTPSRQRLMSTQQNCIELSANDVLSPAEKSRQSIMSDQSEEHSDAISVHSRRTDDGSSCMKKQFSDYIVQIYIDFTRSIIYFVELHKDSIRLRHFEHNIARSTPVAMQNDEKHSHLDDDLNILYAYRIEFCHEPCNKPQFKIFQKEGEHPIFTLCLHEEHLIVRELRRHVVGQNLTLQSSRHGNAAFKTIYSGMIKANVKIRDYKDRIFRIVVE